MLQAARDQFADFWAATVDAAEKLGLDEPSVSVDFHVVSTGDQ